MTGRRGYTLLEVMLVVLIIGMAGILVVTAQRAALKDARLREAARQVQVLNTHARNTAILKQMHTQVRYDNERGLVEVLGVSDNSRRQTEQIALGIDLGSSSSLVYDEDESMEDREYRHASISTRVLTRRKFPLGIKVTEFDSGTDLFETDVFRVDYWPTGYAQGHRIVLEDPSRSENEGVARRVQVTVENITGDISVEKLED